MILDVLLMCMMNLLNEQRPTLMSMFTRLAVCMLWEKINRRRRSVKKHMKTALWKLDCSSNWPRNLGTRTRSWTCTGDLKTQSKTSFAWLPFTTSVHISRRQLKSTRSSSSRTRTFTLLTFTSPYVTTRWITTTSVLRSSLSTFRCIRIQLLEWILKLATTTSFTTERQQKQN